MVLSSGFIGAGCVVIISFKKMLTFGLVLGLPTLVQAQNVNQQQASETAGGGISDSIDCTKIEIKIDEQAGPLTAAERSLLIDKAFYESLSRFDRCQAALLSGGGANSGQTSAGAGAGAGGGGGAKGENNQSVASQSLKGTTTEAKTKENTEDVSVQSVASQSLTGTLPKQEAKSTLEAESEQEDGEKLSSIENIDVSALGNGKLPEDIPSVDNDSVLEKQIRAAAMAEKDPEIKAKLWNEYRKYKGLPLAKAEKQKKP